MQKEVDRLFSYKRKKSTYVDHLNKLERPHFHPMLSLFVRNWLILWQKKIFTFVFIVLFLVNHV